jgi:threonine synthase
MMTGSGDNSSFITHLECSSCNRTADHRELHTVCHACGKTLLARYDLDSARAVLRRDTFAARPRTIWRYQELLPVLSDSNIISLGEGFTPILPLTRLAVSLGFGHLLMKDESFNPTGSFKARGLSAAVSKAKELDVREACMPTAGNAGAALAAYGAAAGIFPHIYMPDDTPRVNIVECQVYGADVHLVRGNISDAAKAMNAERAGTSWFDMSTLKEPYRLEGKKTLGFEIVEQFGWGLPDVIVYPTGGGTGLIGMWKAFDELQQLGWIGDQRPKMVSVQAKGCAPIVKAFESGLTVSEFWNDAATIASGLRVPKAFADSLILKAIYDSGGCALAVDDEEIVRAIRLVASTEGILLSPEGASTIAALPLLRDHGVVQSESRVLLFNTGSGLKYSEVLLLAAVRPTSM